MFKNHFILAAVVMSCEEKQDFHRDNVTPTGLGSAPVSNNALIDYAFTPPKSLATTTGAATAYAGNAVIKAELTFFSLSPMKETQLFQTISGTKTLVSTIPYQAAFSAVKGLDTLLVPYTVPTTAPLNSSIRLDFEIISANGLKAIRTVYVKRTS
jgi:hypothetical protein